MDAMRDAVFPQYSDTDPEESVQTVRESAGSLVSAFSDDAPEEYTERIARRLADAIPEIRSLIADDVEAISLNDPAASDEREILFCYPAVLAILHYRTAHVLHEAGAKVLPRMLSEKAHSMTGIDIHPAARIGRSDDLCQRVHPGKGDHRQGIGNRGERLAYPFRTGILTRSAGQDAGNFSGLRRNLSPRPV